MSDKKKNLINGIFLLTVFVLTIYSVFSGEDLSDIAAVSYTHLDVYKRQGEAISYGYHDNQGILHWFHTDFRSGPESGPWKQDKDRKPAAGCFFANHCLPVGFLGIRQPAVSGTWYVGQMQLQLYREEG